MKKMRSLRDSSRTLTWRERFERLRKLIYDSDGYYNSQDFTLEIAVDDHLQDAQENLGVLSDWDVKLTDHQILMVWLDSFAAKV